jgi:hypothetical protein
MDPYPETSNKRRQETDGLFSLRYWDDLAIPRTRIPIPIDRPGNVKGISSSLAPEKLRYVLDRAVDNQFWRFISIFHVAFSFFLERF